jgi:hypothetical protein
MEYPDALNLLAAIVEQARKDKGKITLQEPTTCPVDYFHSPRRCAREFLSALDTKVRSDAPLTIEEAAVIVMEVIE